MLPSGAAWAGINAALWSVGGLACLLAAAWLQSRKGRFGAARPALVLALAANGGWALCGSILGATTNPTLIAEGLRNLAWTFALYRLFAIDGRHASMKPVRPLLIALAFVEIIFMTGLILLDRNGSALPDIHTTASLHLLIAIGSLVLIHNLYGGAAQRPRLVLRWPAAAMAALWVVDLNHFAIAYLSDGVPQVTSALRGLLGLALAGLLVLGSVERAEELRFSPSRTVAFQSISLGLIGAYLVTMVGVARWLSFAGSNYAALMQVVVVSAASLAVLAVAGSPKLRGWLRVTVLKHLFQHRFDYRAEWLRLTRTIGQSGADGASLGERAVRALADITDSPGGLLLVPGDSTDLVLAARWQWPTAQVPATAISAADAARFEKDGFIAELDQLRRKSERDHPLPEWLLADPLAWTVVPLLHFDRMVGLVVLSRPAHARPLDWEDFDLLRVVGRQLASYMAEQAGQTALIEAARFDDFHRRIAFVMHDIKNLASQMGLLARNAEMHAENPDFRADMLVTLRNSADKLNALIARLSRYGAASVGALAPVRASDVARSVVAQTARTHPVTLVEESPCEVAAVRDSLEQVLLHLVQNAIDASAESAPVFVSVSSGGLGCAIEVIDSGHGMSAEFVRTRLFKPFVSTKPGGFGIGAYEARELVKAMGGRLEVESREGLGTRFIVTLPLAEAAALIDTFNQTGNSGQKVA